MVTVAQLWLPILVSGAVIFIASALMWMIFPHHKKDILFLPKDSPIPGQTRALKPGVYMFPACGDHAEMKTEEFKKRFNEGPWGVITVFASKPSMGRNMILGFIVYLVISAFVAYVTGLARAPGAEFIEVMRVAGATALGIYCLGWMPTAIWFGTPLRGWLTSLVDCIVYGLLTGVIFAWLWPSPGSAVEQILGS